MSRRRRRANPLWHLPARMRRANEADEIERALRDVRALPVSKGYQRGSFVEVACPRCFARSLIGKQEPVDVPHRSGCEGRPYVVEIHARREGRPK